MKLRLIPAIVIAVLGMVIPAKAANLVYLVGLRHVYSIPAYPDVHQLDRQQIEEDYAAEVADAQKHYDSDMASIRDEETKDSGNVHQIDRDQVQENLEKDLADAGEKRESALGQLYTQCDYVRTSHPEFAVDQDGPYRVIEVQTAPTGDYSEVVYYQPYPMYVGVCPYGWAWGEPYPYLAWGVQVRLFHSTWITIGCPVYEPMFYGGAVFVIDAPVRQNVILNRSVWVGGRPPHLTSGERSVLASNAAIQRKSGYYSQGPGGKPLSSFKQANVGGSSAASRYSNAGAAVSKYSRTGSSSSASRYGASGAGSGISRYGRTQAGGSSSSATSTPPSGYSRYSHTLSSGSSTSGSVTTTVRSRYARTGTSGSTATPSSGTARTSRYGRTGDTESAPRPVSGGSSTSRGSGASGEAGRGTSGSSSSSGSVSHGSTGSSGSSESHSSGGSKSPEQPKKKG